MNIRMTDGRVFKGTPRQIVDQMKFIAFGQERRSLSDYIDWVCEELLRVDAIAIDVQGGTDEERAAALVGGILSAGLAERV